MTAPVRDHPPLARTLPAHGASPVRGARRPAWHALLLAGLTWTAGQAGAGGFKSPPLAFSSPANLAAQLAGCGVTILDVRYHGTSNSSGTFSGGTPFIGIDSGVVLSTGFVAQLNQPNTSESTGSDNGLPGDADLEALTQTVAGGPMSQTFDATSLEFDFLTSATTVTVDFVFASDEYNEFANTSFNDIFAFFVNGKNIAYLPDGVTPISINNLNGGNPFGTNQKNPQYYICNATTSDSCTITAGSGWSATRNGGLIYDGLTVVFTVTATLSGDPFHVNHMKIAVADIADHVYDSAVFIRSGSFAVPGCIPPPTVPSPSPSLSLTTLPFDPNVHGYPNPFRPGSGGAQDAATITLRSVPVGGRVRIYTLAGSFVVELKDDDRDGRVTWDARNQSNRPVQSGVYVLVASSLDGREHSRGKVVIIR